ATAGLVGSTGATGAAILPDRSITPTLAGVLWRSCKMHRLAFDPKEVVTASSPEFDDGALHRIPNNLATVIGRTCARGDKTSAKMSKFMSYQGIDTLASQILGS